jgi:hypothetical protein
MRQKCEAIHEKFSRLEVVVGLLLTSKTKWTEGDCLLAINIVYRFETKSRGDHED